MTGLQGAEDTADRVEQVWSGGHRGGRGGSLGRGGGCGGEDTVCRVEGTIWGGEGGAGLL